MRASRVGARVPAMQSRLGMIDQGLGRRLPLGRNGDGHHQLNVEGWAGTEMVLNIFIVAHHAIGETR